MKQILFFAFKEDLLPVLENVERDERLKYVRMGRYSNSDYEVFSPGAALPNLGRATTDSASSCESFLVTRGPLPVAARPVKTDAIINGYVLDQLLNPDSVTFSPGGIWGQGVVLHGRVATVSDSGISQELMRRFSAAIKRRFTKVKAYWVGPHALSHLQDGARLTISAQSPRDFDLTLDPNQVERKG